MRMILHISVASDSITSLSTEGVIGVNVNICRVGRIDLCTGWVVGVNLDTGREGTVDLILVLGGWMGSWLVRIVA